MLVHLWFYSFKVDRCSPQGLGSCLMPASFLKAEGSIPVQSFNPRSSGLATRLSFAPLLLHVCKQHIADGSNVEELGL